MPGSHAGGWDSAAGSAVLCCGCAKPGEGCREPGKGGCEEGGEGLPGHGLLLQ